MSRPLNNLYEFDKFRLDVGERILSRDGEKIPLAEKAFDTLVALVRRGNRLASKDELLAEIWADAFVEENNLDKNVSILRKALGERSGDGRFIETVRGRGFRFIPEVREVARTEKPVARVIDSQAADPPNRSDAAEPVLESANDAKIADANPQKSSDRSDEFRASVAAAESAKAKAAAPVSNRSRTAFLIVPVVFALGLIGFYLWKNAVRQSPDSKIKTIAVLPFKPLLAENRNESLELGMADTLINKLSANDEIIVRPINSVRRYGNLEQDSLAAGRELGTDVVLDGTIQTAGERVRISARLVRTADGKQLWTGQFDEKFTDIFAVQDSISEKVLAALSLTLNRPAQNSLKKGETTNVEAYQLYMKGRFHHYKLNLAEAQKGIEYYNQAIAVDPGYALAYAGIADAYRSFSLTSDFPSGDAMPKGKAAAQKAIELDETLPDAHAALGFIIFFYDWDWAAAEREYRRALELDPNSADTHQAYAHLLSNTGRHAEALAEIRRAREIDPLNLRTNALEGQFLLHAGQTDAALDRLQKTIELDPNFWMAHMFAASAYIEKGMYENAFAEGNEAKRLSPSQNWSIAFGGYALAKAGKTAEARAVLDKLRQSSATGYVPPYHLALVCNGLGETEQALDYLEKGLAERDVRMVFLKVEPKWNNLRGEPRFIELMRKMNFQ